MFESSDPGRMKGGMQKFLFAISIALSVMLTSAFLRERRVLPTPGPLPDTLRAAQQEQPVTAGELPVRGNTSDETLVRHVIDGDTLVLEDDRVIRYVGIDTPEIGKKRAPECFGREATIQNRTLVEGKRVRLETDVSDVDRYGRALRYVYRGDLFVNQLLVREGYARVLSISPDTKFQELFRTEERAAREARRGIWGETCAAPAREDDRDCGDFSNRAEAQTFFLREGGPTHDPHRLDQDGDGIACEGLAAPPS